MSIYWMSWVGVASAAFFGCLLAILVAWCIRVVRVVLSASHDGNTRHARESHNPASTAKATVAPAASSFVEAPKEDPGRVLVGPPMVGQYTLRDYLIHYANDDQIWAKLVAAFYARAAQDPVVFAVFQKVARDKGLDVGELVAQVQKHFLAMLIVLTHVGLTVRLRDSLQSGHAFARISDDAYDRTVTALVQTLTEYGAPQASFPPLVEMVSLLQPYVVTV